MKKVLFVIPSFGHGGTNKSLWNFLSAYPHKDLDVHILCMGSKGPYREKFSLFHLLPECIPLSALEPFALSTAGDSIFKKAHKLFWKLLYKIFLRSNKERLFSYAAKKYKKDGYDVVVAFQEGVATAFVAHIYAEKHIAWVRCDYSNYLRLAKKSEESEIYRHFNDIVCVSKYTANIFKSYYPDFSQNVHAVYNIIDADGIIAASKDTIKDPDFNNDLFTLVSVGRMDPVKRFRYIPSIAKAMRDNGCLFKWYIIGGGGTETEEVKKKIKEFDVGEQVILLGERSNPYPYIATADVLVCPSITEACPNVVNEAKILHIPPIVADFPTAFEFVTSGENGLILTIDEMSNALINLYFNRNVLSDIRQGVGSFVYQNEEICEQLSRLLSK